MKGNKVRINSDRAKAWKVMRGWNGVFTASEIAAIAEADYHNIKRYIRCLYDAGFLRNEGRRGHEKIYRLIRNTGPKPPVQKQIKFIYDPNADEYYVVENGKYRRLKHVD
jgi:hypothetical protein